MFKVVSCLLFCFSGIALHSMDTETMHKCFFLVRGENPLMAEEILADSLMYETHDGKFLAKQFIHWSAKQNCEMTNHFNESSYHVVKNDRESAIKAITNYFDNPAVEITDFAESFVDWGLNMLSDIQKLVKEIEQL